MTTTFAQGPRTRTHRAFHEDLARGHHVPFTTALHEDTLCTRNTPKDEPRQGLVHMRTLQGEVPCTTASHEDEPCTRDSQTAVPCTRTLHKRGYQRAQGRASCEGFARGRSWHWGLARGLSMSGARCRGGDGTAASPGPICGALREGERGGGKRRWAARAGTHRPSVAGPFSLRVPAVAAGAAPDSGERHGLARPERETLRYSHNAFCCLTSLRFNRTSHLTAARYVCFWHVPCGHAGPMRQPGLADGSRLEFPQ